MTERPESIYIIGAGGHAKVAIRAAQLSGIKIVAVFDDAAEKQGTTICEVPIVGAIHSILEAEPLPTLIAIGDNALRMRLADQWDLAWATVIHPQSCIDRSVEIGVGTLVLAGAVVQVDAHLGNHVVINNNATVEHDCRVETGAHLSGNACLAGASSIGSGTLVGIGASVLPGVRVGEYSTVGAGAVVANDLGNGVTAVGVPARVVEKKGEASGR